MDCFNKECRPEAFDFCLGHGTLSCWVGNGLGYITRSYSSGEARTQSLGRLFAVGCSTIFILFLCSNFRPPVSLVASL